MAERNWIGAARGMVRGRTIVLDYPPSSRNEPRWGRKRPVHPQLAALLGEYEAQFAAALDLIGTYEADLRALMPRLETDSDWGAKDFDGLDAAALYSYVRSRAPRTYVEVGSGHSTRIAAAAKRDGKLRTRIVSIDPSPRLPIDGLCDLAIRMPLEEADLAIFRSLGEGDVVLVDGSHRVFMNSDVVVFMLEILPALAPGVLTAVHDVFLPDDYPIEWASRFYSEQYLLAAWLLARGEEIAPVLASHFVCCTPSLNRNWIATADAIGLTSSYGSSLWIERRGS